MFLQFRLLSILSIIFISFSACNKLPNHAKYIPKDAAAVIGINTKELSKEIAWNAIIGSKLFDEMKNKMPQKGSLEALGDAGIEIMSTSYVYIKTDKQSKNGARITALIPLADIAKWEAYVKRIFPLATIKKINNRKEAALANGMYVGWTDHLLVIMNILQKEENHIEVTATSDQHFDEAATDSITATVKPATSFVTDEAQLSAAMKNAFTLSKDNELADDKRFKALETSGHDVSFWVNYDVIMTQNGDKINDMAGGLALSGNLWKDAAFAAGFDFEKGKITGDILYYTSKDLNEVSKMLGNTNADEQLLNRLPTDDLNMLLALHLAPKGIKGIFEKMGVLGFANLALSSEGLTTDDFFEAFTGDMGMAINNFYIQKMDNWKSNKDSSFIWHSDSKSDMNLLLAMKIGNKEKFNKLLTYAVNKEIIKPAGNNTYITASNDSIFLATDNSYLSISNKKERAQDYVLGKFKDQKSAFTAKKEIYGHPLGVYVNFQTILNSIETKSGSEADFAAMAESKKLFDNIILNGGDFKNGAFNYHIALNFMNKNENSLFQIMDFTMKINETTEISAKR